MTDGDLDGDDVLVAVDLHLVSTLGPDAGRAGISFVGTDRIDVARFHGHDGLVHYVTLGMARAPLPEPTATVVETVSGPRAELVLTLRRREDSVVRRLAIVAAAPVVEGLRLVPGASVDLRQPLWDGAPFTGLLIAQPRALVPDLPLEPDADGRQRGPVSFLPVIPLLPAEVALKREQGTAALEERWLLSGTDLRDPDRAF